jgi:hypothetical protein
VTTGVPFDAAPSVVDTGSPRATTIPQGTSTRVPTVSAAASSRSATVVASPATSRFRGVVAAAGSDEGGEDARESGRPEPSRVLTPAPVAPGAADADGGRDGVPRTATPATQAADEAPSVTSTGSAAERAVAELPWRAVPIPGIRSGVAGCERRAHGNGSPATTLATNATGVIRRGTAAATVG